MKTFNEYRDYFEAHMLDVFPEQDKEAEVLFDETDESMQPETAAGSLSSLDRWAVPLNPSVPLQ